MSILYNNNSAIGRLFQYFSAYFTSATRPTRTLLTWLLIGMLVLEGMPSIRWLYRHFLSQVYPKSLNCYNSKTEKRFQMIHSDVSSGVSVSSETPQM